MDYLRSCYKSSMRLFSDRPDVLTEGQWIWCPPGAKRIPFPHAFVSQNWDPKHTEGDPLVGEIRGPRTWVNGACPPQYTGTHFCGDMEVWQNGILYADRPGLEIGADGFPTCCPHLPMMSAKLGFDASAAVYQLVTSSVSLAMEASATVTRYLITACAPGPVPATLFARFSLGTGCSDLDGHTFQLDYTPHAPADPGWKSAPFSVDGSFYVFYFWCLFASWRFSVRALIGGGEAIGGAGALVSYPPLVVAFTGITTTFGACVLTGATVEVTES